VFPRFFAAAVFFGCRCGTVCACAPLLAAVSSLCLPLAHDRSWTRLRREAGCLTSLAAALCASGRLSLAAHENR